MASKRSGQDAKCSRAVSIKSRSKQPLQKKTGLNSKFDNILNWQCIFAIQIVEMNPLIIILLNVLHAKILHT